MCFPYYVLHWGCIDNLLWRSGSLLNDADEREAGPPVDVVLLLGEDEGLGGHNMEAGAAGANRTVLKSNLQNKKTYTENCAILHNEPDFTAVPY